MKKAYPIISVFLMVAGCTSYTGDALVSYSSLPVEPSGRKVLLTLEEKLLSLYGELIIPQERRVPLDAFPIYNLIQENGSSDFAHKQKAVFLIDGDVDISHCYSCVVIASGNIHVGHSGDNILISGKNISVSHDRAGSIIIANGSVNISFAYNTTIYASEGLRINHASNVIAYNTESRKTSWGHVNSIFVEPLFKNEGAFNE
jgi:hypothetical protein